MHISGVTAHFGLLAAFFVLWSSCGRHFRRWPSHGIPTEGVVNDTLSTTFDPARITNARELFVMQRGPPSFVLSSLHRKASFSGRLLLVVSTTTSAPTLPDNREIDRSTAAQTYLLVNNSWLYSDACLFIRTFIQLSPREASAPAWACELHSTRKASIKGISQRWSQLRNRSPPAYTCSLR